MTWLFWGRACVADPMCYRELGTPPLPTMRLRDRKWRGSTRKPAPRCTAHAAPEITFQVASDTTAPSGCPPDVTACLPVVGSVIGFIPTGSMHLAVKKDICHFATDHQIHHDLNDCDNRELNHSLKFQRYL